MFTKVKNWLRCQSNNDNCIGHLIKFIYLFLQAPASQAILNVAFATYLAICGILVTEQNRSKIIGNMKFAGVIYVVVIFLCYQVNNHIKKKQDDLKWFQYGLKKMMFLNRFISNKSHKLSKEILKQAYNGRLISLDHVKDIMGFQQVAFNVCNEIYGLLCSLGIRSGYVTIYQQFVEDGLSFCKMVAYQNADSDIPGSYEEKYELNKSDNSNKHLHRKIFEKGSEGIYVLANREEVSRKFLINEVSREREEKICQYIGIPYRVNKKNNNINIAFLLQIDCDKENAFGNNKHEIKELASNIFKPFLNILAVAYEQENIMESYQKSMHIMYIKKSEVEEDEKKA